MKSFWCACVAILMFSVAHAAPETSASVYNLKAELTDQAGVRHGLDLHRGQPVLVTMFYGSCPMTCPLLIDTLRTIERGTSPTQRDALRVLLISIDPEHDTPAALAKLAKERRIDTSRWTLARTDERTVAKIAALLNVQYRELPSGGYNHSSVIALLSAQGEIAAQSTLLGKADAALMEAIDSTAAQSLAATR